MKISPIVFPLGRDALSWLRQGGRPTRGGWVQEFLYRWQGFWFERNLALQRRVRPLSVVGMPPIFVLGLWRSGTTYLHDLMASCPGMICPATWQCMNPSTFRLRQPPSKSKVVTRPMDKFTIDAFSPQEDEFALLALGVPTVYRGFLDPRRLDEVSQWLDPDAWVGRLDGWMQAWLNFLAGVADGKTGRLLLKSPSHTFRIRALMEAFPDAAYVWVVRDPAEVFLSNRKMWSSMFGQYALWNWEMSELDAFLQQAFESTARCLDYATRALPAERLAVVDFVRLTGAPAATTDAINLRLNLGDQDRAKSAKAKAAAGKAGYRADSYDGQTLPPQAALVLDRLRIVQQAALISHGV